MEGSKLTFKADDGRVLDIDMSQVSPNVQRALTPGEGAEVVGHFKGDQNHIAARWIQQDSSNPARGGKVSGHPAASPKTGDK